MSIICVSNSPFDSGILFSYIASIIAFISFAVSILGPLFDGLLLFLKFVNATIPTIPATTKTTPKTIQTKFFFIKIHPFFFYV